MTRKTLLILLSLILCATATVRADVEEQRIKAVESASKWVVSVRTYRQGKDKPGIGSGVVLRSDGYIITNAHVVSGGKIVKVHLKSGKSYTAKIWKMAAEQDLALLKIDVTGLPVAKIGDSDKVRLGQTVIAIGDPLGFTGTVTVGTVGGLNRNVETRGIKYKNLIQTDAAINPGSSGGALVNLKGEVIGINALVYTGPSSGYDKAQGLGFAIPINSAIKIARQLVLSQPTSQAGGKAWLGINGENLSADKAADYGIKVKVGVLVTGITSGSPAATAGLQVGDAVSAIDGRTIRNVPDMLDVLAARKPGDQIVLTVWRGDAKLTVPVTLDMQSQ